MGLQVGVSSWLLQGFGEDVRNDLRIIWACGEGSNECQLFLQLSWPWSGEGSGRKGDTRRKISWRSLTTPSLTIAPEESLLQGTSIWVALQGPEGGEAEYLTFLLCFASPLPTPSSGITGEITQHRKTECTFLSWMWWGWAVGVLGGDKGMVTVKILQCCSGMFVVKMPLPLVWSVLDPWLSLNPAVETKAATPHTLVPPASPTYSHTSFLLAAGLPELCFAAIFFKAFLINQNV